MIKDLLNNTKKNLNYNKIEKLKDIDKTSFLMVDFSDKIKISVKEIRYFLKMKMYNNINVLKKNDQGKLIVKRLFNKIKSNPKKFILNKSLEVDKYRTVSDFISGMTDRYAIKLYNNIR